MKVCKLVLALAALVAASPTFAADGRPSNATLAAMGLADLNVISDDAGLAVRGFGFFGAKAYGQSFAVVATKGGAAGSNNGYFATGKKYASGDNFSYAKVEVTKSGGHKGGGKKGGGNMGGSYGNQSYGGSGGGHGSSGGHGGGKSFSIGAFAGGSSTGYRK
jgi:hypothetical protein